MKNHITILLLLVVFTPTLLNAQTNEKKEIRIKANLYEKNRGTDENIITIRPSGDEPLQKPEQKAEEMCIITINNYTGYTIDLYVDGYYSGTVAAYSSVYIFVPKSTTKVYGKSVGGTYVWEWNYVNCEYVMVLE